MNMTLRRLGFGAIGGNAVNFGNANWYFGASCNDGVAIAGAALWILFLSPIFWSRYLC